MVDREVVILRVAEVVREVLEELARPKEKVPWSWWDDDLGGACGLASVVLVRALRRRGVQARPHAGTWGDGGDEHCWVILGDGRYLDVTATQFLRVGYGHRPVIEPIPKIVLVDPGSSPYPYWGIEDVGWWRGTESREREALVKRVERRLRRVESLLNG